MNGSEIVQALDRLTWEQVRAMSPKDLRRFRDLCHHWHQLAEVEIARQNREESR